MPPPKAKAKGAAAEAKAKATAAGKAKTRARGLGQGGAAVPEGAPLPPEPLPAATRRWLHCGWDADFYDNEVALAVPGELIEAVVQDASGAARGCVLLEVLSSPSRLNLQGYPWEEGCVFPVRFIACEDAGTADWAANAFVAGGTELFLPKQYEVDKERLANVGVAQCARWRWRPAGHFPETWVPEESWFERARARAPPVVPRPPKAAPKAKAPVLPVAPPAASASPATAKATLGLPAAPAPGAALPGPMDNVQALASQFGGCALPPKLDAAPASHPGLLPPLGQDGAQGLPAAPGDGGAESAKSGKKKKVKKKLGKKKVVNDVLLLRSKAKEEDDTSDEDPRLSEERRAARRIKKREAKDEEEHRSIKDSSSSSEDMRAELFRDAASSGSLVNRIQRVAQESPGALLDSGLKAMRRFLDPRNHQGSGGRKQGLTPHVTQYLTTVVQALKGRELGLRSERELRTLSEALDHLLSGNLAACGDTLMQRFKAVELAGEAGWAVASRMELIPQSAVSAGPSEE